MTTTYSTTMDLSQPVDEAFTKALPKIELHAHLSGSISRQCLHELWEKKKSQDPNFPIEDPWVLMPPGKVDYTLETFFQTFSKSIYHLCNDLESLSYATNSVLSNFYEDGVRYLELRSIPRAFSGSDVSKEGYVTAVLDSIDSFKARTNNDMPVYLILAIDRKDTAAQALDTVNLAIKYRPRGVVGIDICGNPNKGDVSIYRGAFTKAKANGLRITVHFAETPFSGSPAELETLLSYQPDRLGHVIHVPDDIKQEIARRQLGLELCLSCNVHAKMINGGFLDHHFGYWRHVDCPVILCTDDMGFFCSPVSNEYLLAAHHFNLSRADVLALCRKSFRAIFGGPEEKDRLYTLLDNFEAGSQ